MTISQEQELAVILTNFLVDARVQFFIQSHHQLALGGAMLRQVPCLLRIFLQVIDFKVVVGD